MKGKRRGEQPAAQTAAATPIAGSGGSPTSAQGDPSAPRARGASADDDLPPASLEDFSAARLDWPAVRALFERQAASSLGRRALLELEPRSPLEARAAHARVAELLALPASAEGPPLGELADPLPVLEDASLYNRAITGDGFVTLISFMRARQRIVAWLEEHRDSAPELARLRQGLPDLSALHNQLEAGIDPRGRVRDGASARLAGVRERMGKLMRALEQAAKTIAARPDLRSVFADGQVGRVHLRGGRPVLAVRAKSAGRLRGIVHDTSATGGTVFIEPESLIARGNELAGVRSEEEREVSRLFIEWTQSALERAEAMERVAERLAEVELAVIGARGARALDARPATIPAVGEPAVLVLKEARHPLLVDQQKEGALERAVPIDLRLGDSFDVLVITGPNTGGKTLSLKAAGMAALLTRLGLPFPCGPGSTIPIYSGVVADIGDEQEVQQSLSTFSGHLARIAAGLARAGPRMLFLLDELGGGTDPAEGAALGAALLDHLLVAGAPTLASTHIGRLKEFAFSRPRAENASAEFDAETLRPLYRLVVGAPGESRALQIAQRLGFEPSILAEARRRLERPSAESEKLMGDLRAAREQAEKDRAEAEARLAAAELHQSELEREAGELAHQRDMLLDEAQAALEARTSAARGVVDQLRAVAGQLAGGQRAKVDALLGELERALAAGGLTDRRQAFLDQLRKGDLVFVPRYSKRCPVQRLDRAKGRIVVRLGQRDLELRLEDVSGIEAL
ncbi:Endonuclease MutS2 [Planctomycetes bacterium Pla86]|uniref:Endonuclease MutS2 n=2 Tax=Engelhardtia mirabilis TaxID=2528011 RepID=A0A518BPF8_9BACT|nr:Endonuclease MutS2 [Planctomycetes bacterium Pla133]QDV03182.1 Endonuclease MutS2 [Planctomycetes bacterium Pla86]